MVGIARGFITSGSSHPHRPTMPAVPADTVNVVLSEELLGQKQSDRPGVQRGFTWEEVKQIVAAERLDLLGRVTEKELAYREDMQKICEEYGSVVAYIQQVKLGDFIRDTVSELLMIPNDYPYSLPDNTLHYIVWSKIKLTPGTVPDAAVRQFFEGRLDKEIGTGKYEWVWFVNPPHLQSIPEVIHGHLILQKLE
ncbi:hypothetical protein GGI15_003042 [Coemansia interrupta]|uniref:Uncharacterized protein n=1 Tax=Coemansia interrupta TaxID=1126814 RepID=A0A9W8LIM2_9FUNG|nr:hypothetical protein GGI15_003042 [Coemansia interrupta]